MNYPVWIRNNQWELVLGVYLVLLFLSHHTFTPNLYWFRNLTSNTLFRLVLLGWVLYCLYWGWGKKVSPRQMRLFALLVAAFLLTEYHAWNRHPWEFFDNPNIVVYIKKSGQDLYLTPGESGQKVSLSEFLTKDSSQQAWQLDMSSKTTYLSPVGSNNGLTGGLTIGSGQDHNWQLGAVDESKLDKDVKTKDEQDIKFFTGESGPCQESDGTLYVTLQFIGDGEEKNKYLVASKDNGFQPSLSSEESPDDGAWLLYFCIKKTEQKDTTAATAATDAAATTGATTGVGATEETSRSEGEDKKECLTIENYANPQGKALDLNKALLTHVFHKNDLNGYLNGHREDSPAGKAYRKCVDGICYYDAEDTYRKLG